MALYDQAFCYCNGGLLGQNMSVDVEHADDIAQVKVIPVGFVGITPGAPVTTVKIKNAVPITGFEFDFALFMREYIAFEFKVQLGGSGLSCIGDECYVIGPTTLSTALGKPTEQDVTIVFRTPDPPWV